MELEKWLPIVGYEGIYEVSNMGKVKSLARTIITKRGVVKKYGEFLFKEVNTTFGYKSVSLTKDGKKKGFLIHRLVGIAFLHNPNNYPEINHKEGNRWDNRADKLEWCDRFMNMQHAFKVLKRKGSCGTTGWVGHRNKQSQPVLQYDKLMNFIKRHESMHQASIATKVHFGTIKECAKGKRKSAGGFIWVKDIREIADVSKEPPNLPVILFGWE